MNGGIRLLFLFCGTSAFNQGIDGLMEIRSLVSRVFVYCDVEYIIVLKASLKANSAWPAAEKFG